MISNMQIILHIWPQFVKRHMQKNMHVQGNLHIGGADAQDFRAVGRQTDGTAVAWGVTRV